MNVFAFKCRHTPADDIMSGLGITLAVPSVVYQLPSLSRWLKEERWNDFEPEVTELDGHAELSTGEAAAWAEGG